MGGLKCQTPGLALSITHVITEQRTASPRPLSQFRAPGLNIVGSRICKQQHATHLDGSNHTIEVGCFRHDGDGVHTACVEIVCNLHHGGRGCLAVCRYIRRMQPPLLWAQHLHVGDELCLSGPLGVGAHCTQSLIANSVSHVIRDRFACAWIATGSI